MPSDQPPMQLDLARSPNDHVAFGGGGPHFCVGAHIARVEIHAILRELLTRLVDLRPAGPTEWLPSTFISGPKHLPVEFEREVKRIGSVSGPKMPNGGRHVGSPSSARLGHGVGEDRQRLLHLGTSEAGTEAVVRPSAEREVRLALGRDVERPRLVVGLRVVVGRRRRQREHRAGVTTGSRRTRSPRPPSGARRRPRRGSASPPRPPGEPRSDPRRGASIARDARRTATWPARAGCAWCRSRRTRSAAIIDRTSSSERRSSASRACTSAVTRSSCGSRRRSAIRPVTYSNICAMPHCDVGEVLTELERQRPRDRPVPAGEILVVLVGHAEQVAHHLDRVVLGHRGHEVAPARLAERRDQLFKRGPHVGRDGRRPPRSERAADELAHAHVVLAVQRDDRRGQRLEERAFGDALHPHDVGNGAAQPAVGEQGLHLRPAR